ncbi:MAG: lysylphosphatidylglycerol synthase domain-containing protein, partial [Acidobacteriota bacterium]|nr:lysylphosphatidylglycerol synthase domain-containing protein [Acidobacteriota bacterium]
MSRRKIVSLAVSLALSVFLLAILLGRIRTQDLLATLSGVSLPTLALYAAITLLAAVLRAWRYRLLLAPGSCGFGPMLLVTLVRNAFEDLLPARIGSLSYIYFLDARLGVAFENAASSFILAFLIDFLTLGPFVLLAVLSVGRSADFPAGLLL